MASQHEKIRNLVKDKYAAIAQAPAGPASSACCSGPAGTVQILDMGKILGYTEGQLALSPGEANLGLGCGNPIDRAGLKPGEWVLDLGSGAGFDAFLAARLVGTEGRVIGVDMTPEMIAKANINARKLAAGNVEFRLGEIEKLPVSDASVDVVLSNCVINLSPDKRAVFAEIFRTLKPGGRISLSDVLRSAELPREIKEDPAAYCG